jgi:hypothetical protein
MNLVAQTNPALEQKFEATQYTPQEWNSPQGCESEVPFSMLHLSSMPQIKSGESTIILFG